MAGEDAAAFIEKLNTAYEKVGRRMVHGCGVKMTCTREPQTHTRAYPQPLTPRSVL